jgi:hypothetical protein
MMLTEKSFAADGGVCLLEPHIESLPVRII